MICKKIIVNLFFFYTKHNIDLHLNIKSFYYIHYVYKNSLAKFYIFMWKIMFNVNNIFLL